MRLSSVLVVAYGGDAGTYVDRSNVGGVTGARGHCSRACYFHVSCICGNLGVVCTTDNGACLLGSCYRTTVALARLLESCFCNVLLCQNAVTRASSPPSTYEGAHCAVPTNVCVCLAIHAEVSTVQEIPMELRKTA